jgi:hypothetical protein
MPTSSSQTEQPTTDNRHKSANPGEPYENAEPGKVANDTLGRKGYQPPGGAQAVMKDQQKTADEIERAAPGDQPTGRAEA